MTVYVSVMDTIEESKERDETSQVEKRRANHGYDVLLLATVSTSFSAESHVQKGWTSHRQLGVFNEPSYGTRTWCNNQMALFNDFVLRRYPSG